MNSYAFFKFLDFPFNLFDVLWNYLNLIPLAHFTSLAHLVDIHFTYLYISESLKNQIRLYEAWNMLEKANKWRAKLPQTEAVDE
jgi:hypothetical protein